MTSAGLIEWCFAGFLVTVNICLLSMAACFIKDTFFK